MGPQNLCIELNWESDGTCLGHIKHQNQNIAKVF